AKAKSLVVLDHHQTAEAELVGLKPQNGAIHFDMERSGIGMAWDHFMGSRRPWIVNYIEDRDLWRKALPHSDMVNAYLGTLEYSFMVWDAFYDSCDVKTNPMPEYILAG